MRRTPAKHTFRPSLEVLEARNMLDASQQLPMIPNLLTISPLLPPQQLTGPQIVQAQATLNTAYQNQISPALVNFVNGTLATLLSQDFQDGVALIYHGAKFTSDLAQIGALEIGALAAAGVEAAPAAESPAFIAETLANYNALIAPLQPQIIALYKDATDEATEVGTNPLFQSARGQVVLLYNTIVYQQQLQQDLTLMAAPVMPTAVPAFTPFPTPFPTPQPAPTPQPVNQDPDNDGDIDVDANGNVIDQT